MSDNLNLFDKAQPEQDRLLEELRSLRELLDDQATKARHAAAGGRGRRKAADKAAPSESSRTGADGRRSNNVRSGDAPRANGAGIGSAAGNDNHELIPELSDELIIAGPVPKARAKSGPGRTPNAANGAKESIIPILSEVVFSGTEVPDEAIALMSSINAKDHPSEQQIEAIVNKIVEQKVEQLRVVLRKRVVAEVRARLGLDAPPSRD